MDDYDNGDDDIVLFRSKNVSIEQMCAALPNLFKQFKLDAIDVRPFPILLQNEDEKEIGDGFLFLMFDGDMIILGYDFVIKGFKEEPLQ